jgi:hypothetical protein
MPLERAAGLEPIDSYLHQAGGPAASFGGPLPDRQEWEASSDWIEASRASHISDGPSLWRMW